MDEFLRLNNLAHFGLWLLIACLSILAHLLPLSYDYDSWPGPDLFLALTLAWLLRRPAQVPAPAIVLVFFLEDLFLMRPPGLTALVVLAGTEFLRRRQSIVREMNLLLEWAMVSGTMIAMFIATRSVLMIVMIPRDPLDLSLIKLVSTLLAYPVVVFILQSAFGVRKPATGEVDDRGRKL